MNPQKGTTLGPFCKSQGSVQFERGLDEHRSTGRLNLLHGSFRKLGVPHIGVLIIRILLFGVVY